MSVTPGERRTFPLVPRRRLTGLPFGDLASRRPGQGTDTIGLRSYEPGDPINSIDWFASARLSGATGGDEFVVRRRASDESPRVVVLVDRRPAMALYPTPFPWLSKRDALREAVAAIVASAAASQADVASLDFADGRASWLAPGRRERSREVVERHGTGLFSAPEDTIERGLAFLAERRMEVRPGTFVFVLSDFLVALRAETWLQAVARGWELVPVIVRDPVWESGFPAVDGVALPVADPVTGRVGNVRLGRRAVAARRALHERRSRALLAELDSFGLRSVSIVTSDAAAVDAAFIDWAEERRRLRWTD